MAELTFTHEPSESRYTLHAGDDLVSALDYRDNGHTIALTRAFTVPSFRGHGYAAIVTERAVDAIQAAGDRKILAVCWYVADWFRNHPERQSLLEHPGGV